MFSFRTLPLSLVSLFILNLLFSCASRNSGWDENLTKINLSKDDRAQLEIKAQTAWSKRHIKQDLLEALEHFESLANASLDREFYKYATLLTRGFYLLADAHEEDIEAKKRFWNIGTAWSEKAMALNSDFKKAVDRGEDVTDALKFLDKSYVDVMYWSAANLGKWAKSSGIATSLKYKDRIRKLIIKVEEFDPSFFYAAASRYWGAYYAVAPAFAGGDIKKSKESFEKSILLAPTYLGTQVLFAELYDTKKMDKKSFALRLKKVLETPDIIDPAIMPENIIEKRKAKKLLAEMDQLF
jgi:hypothetical protein